MAVLCDVDVGSRSHGRRRAGRGARGRRASERRDDACGSEAFRATAATCNTSTGANTVARRRIESTRATAARDRRPRSRPASTWRSAAAAGRARMGLDVEIGVLNELQPGSYVFMDREYRDALGDDPEGRFEQSLTLRHDRDLGEPRRLRHRRRRTEVDGDRRRRPAGRRPRAHVDLSRSSVTNRDW